jgi:hypothetical protein
MAQVVELGRLRELTLKGSLASPTSISWNCTSSIMKTSASEIVRIPYTLDEFVMCQVNYSLPYTEILKNMNCSESYLMRQFQDSRLLDAYER